MAPCLLLFIIIGISTNAMADGPFTRMDQIPSLSPGFCVATETVNLKYYNYVTDPSVSVVFDVMKGWTIIARERCDPSSAPALCATYTLEGVRYFSSPLTKCIYCPYHLDPWWSPSINPSVDQTAMMDDPSAPMFGPCLGNSYSLKLPCLQHHALYPKKFFGEYFFPSQRPTPDSFWQEWFANSAAYNIPMHQFLHEGASSTPYNMFGQLKDPSDYGLGKKVVEAHLAGINFIYNANGTINTELTNAFKAPYRVKNSVEQWMKWAQYFCFPGCHKTDRFSLFSVRSKDILGDPELSYLSMYTNSSVPQYIPACRPCPNYTASYNWIADSQTYGPAHPKTNLLADQCYPWFGAIPTMVPLGDSFVMNTTNSVWNSEVDRVFSPDYDTIVDFSVCPENTYNRVCAHTKEYVYAAAYDAAPSGIISLSKYACTPCPSGGYHTAGKKGQWYCQPPPGKIFAERAFLLKDKIWGKRNSIMSQYPELECGPKPEHCRQCNEYNLNNYSPEQFNEELIFSRLLAETWCPERYYCPDAYSQIECPSERPWSPLGSWNVSNCTCTKGFYLNASLGCVPCTPSCNIPGYYLPRSQCIEKNGATRDAPCAPCHNIPSERAIPDGSGVELRPGYGTCPFHCILGSEIYTSNASMGRCEKSLSCLPPIARTNKEGRYVYKDTLKYDKMTVEWSSLSSFACVVYPLFSQQLASIESAGEWYLQPLSCIGVCNLSLVCYAQNQTAPLMDASIPWYSVNSLLSCQPCPSLPLLPPQAYISAEPVKDLQLGAQFCQTARIFCSSVLDDMMYFNKTAWQCQSCMARERLICPQATRLRGNGCLGVNAPFNASFPAADCMSCPLQVPNATRGKLYLNYMNSSAPGGCSIDPCPGLMGSNYYWRQPCGGDSPGEQKLCTSDCRALQFRKAECSAYADLVCQNCTTTKAGFIKTMNCSLREDSVWRPCDPGFYCDVLGRVTPCPANKTSLAGADDPSDCFCKVGMQEDARTSTCIPMQCSDAVLLSNLPGKNMNSSYYMTLDPSTMSSTKCMPCNTFPSSGPLAFTRGDGLEIISCVCPQGYYGVYPGSSPISIQCSPCPATACSSLRLPASCSEGDVKIFPGQSFPCNCAPPPFSNTNPVTCQSSCQSGFLNSNIPRPIRSGSVPQVSGSSLFAPSRSWNRMIASSGITSFNNSVRALTTSGCMDDSILGNENTQVYHYEYVFWILADPGLPIIFSAPLQEEADLVSSALLTMLPQWQIFPPDPFRLTTDIVVAVAASKWSTRDAQSYAYSAARDPWIYVAALLRANDEGRGLFYMKVNVFNTTHNPSTGGWEDKVSTIPLFTSFASSQNVVHVSIAHANKKLGEIGLAGEGGYFYTAFNVWEEEGGALRCGGIVIASPLITNTPVQFVTAFCKSAWITSMALFLSQESSMLTAIVSLSSGNMLRIEANSQTDPQVLPVGPNPFSSLSNLMVMFSHDNPIMIAVISSESACGTNRVCLKAADAALLSWVDVQGMPWGTEPTTMAASVMTNGKALLVVSKEESIFSLPVSRCSSPTQYWDGVACTEHTCLKQASCTFPMIPTSDGMGCMCANGYYTGTQSSSLCISCKIPNYCEGGMSLTCPYGTSTTVNAAPSVNSCVCPIQGTFFNNLLAPPRCVECRSSDAWCPNRWQSFSCPGTFAVSTGSLSSSLLVYPTKCACAAGFTGANCEPCPDGYYCPANTGATAMNTAAFYRFPQPPLTSVVLELINTFFLSYFTQTGTKLPNFGARKDLSRILFTEITPATNRTQYGIMVMIQLDLPSATSYDNFKNWHGPLFDYLKTSIPTISVTPISSATTVFETVPVNRPLQCMTSKVPGNPPSSCTCAPGYETNKEQCSACPVNFFKAASGPGVCVACAIGTVSTVAASACIPDPALLSSNQNAGGPNLVVLLGGIAGGVVGMILLLFLVQTVVKRTNTKG